MEKVVKVHVALCSSCRRTCKRSRDGLPGNNNRISRTNRFAPRYTTTPMRNHRRTPKSCLPVETLRQLRPNVRDDYTPRSDNTTDSNRTPTTLHFMPPSSTVASKVSCTICRPTSVARKRPPSPHSFVSASASPTRLGTVQKTRHWQELARKRKQIYVSPRVAVTRGVEGFVGHGLCTREAMEVCKTGEVSLSETTVVLTGFVYVFTACPP